MIEPERVTCNNKPSRLYSNLQFVKQFYLHDLISILQQPYKIATHSFTHSFIQLSKNTELVAGTLLGTRMQEQTGKNTCLGGLAFIPTEGIAALTMGRLRLAQSLQVTEPE